MTTRRHIRELAVEGGAPSKTFELSLQIRNNLLRERRLKAGLNNTELAERCGVNNGAYGDLETLKASPISRRTGTWREVAVKIARFWGVTPFELWPESVHLVKKTKATVKLEAEDLTPLLPPSETFSEGSNTLALPPDELFERCEEARAAQRVITALRPKEQIALTRRFDGESLDDIAATLGVSRERARQLSKAAAQKINKQLAKDRRAEFIANAKRERIEFIANAKKAAEG